MIETQEFKDSCVCSAKLIRNTIASQTFVKCSKCGSLHRIESITPVITKAQYEAIHSDYRNIWSNEDVPENVGKRSCFAGCIIPNGGTTIVIEGSGFYIKS